MARKSKGLTDDEFMTDEQRLMDSNLKLIESHIDEPIICELHNISKLWTELSEFSQVAVLAGLDSHEDSPCCLTW